MKNHLRNPRNTAKNCGTCTRNRQMRLISIHFSDRTLRQSHERTGLPIKSDRTKHHGHPTDHHDHNLRRRRDCTSRNQGHRDPKMATIGNREALGAALLYRSWYWPRFSRQTPPSIPPADGQARKKSAIRSPTLTQSWARPTTPRQVRPARAALTGPRWGRADLALGIARRRPRNSLVSEAGEESRGRP